MTGEGAGPTTEWTAWTVWTRWTEGTQWAGKGPSLRGRRSHIGGETAARRVFLGPPSAQLGIRES